jgi:parallel beta-helix repeat protein
MQRKCTGLPHACLGITIAAGLLAFALDAPAQVSPQEAGSIVLTVTAYPYPDDALFVATDGNDDNAGSIDDPFATIAFALRAAADGGTIVVRGGVYREQLPTISRRVTVQPYPNEAVWLKGSVVAADWSRSGSRWRWTGHIDPLDRATYAASAVDERYPYAGFPEMVFIDGRALQQVGEMDDLGPGRFFVDGVDGTVLIGNDPKGHLVEIARYPQALRIKADGTTIRGLGFMHYAGGRLEGMLQIEDSENVIVENNSFAWSASRGMALYRGRGALIRGNLFAYNGLMGLASWRFDDVVIEGNRFIANNQERFLTSGEMAEAAGAKLTEGRHIEVRDNDFEDNLAAGLWLDISISDSQIIGNRVVGNASHGIYYEISANAIIASNLIAHNGTGIRLSNASSVKVYNNTLVSNELGVAVQDDERFNADAVQRRLGISYVTSDISLVNNIIVNCEEPSSSALWVRDYNSRPLKDPAEMIATADGNVYCSRDVQSRSKLFSWWSNGRERIFKNLAQLRAATGFEAHGRLLSESRMRRILGGDSAAGQRLSAERITSALPLPPDVAGALGVVGDPVLDVGIVSSEFKRSVRFAYSGDTND